MSGKTMHAVCSKTTARFYIGIWTARKPSSALAFLRNGIRTSCWSISAFLPLVFAAVLWMTTKELRAARDRWLTASRVDPLKAAREEYGGVIQCGGCRWFGAFDADFGLCCNPASSFDGKVTFEHGGCEKHSNIEDGTVVLDGDDIRWP